MGINDESGFPKYEKEEFEHPIPREVVSDRTVYLSRPLPLTLDPLFSVTLAKHD